MTCGIQDSTSPASCAVIFTDKMGLGRRPDQLSFAPYEPSARHLKVAQFDGTHTLSAEFADEVAKVKNNVWRALRRRGRLLVHSPKDGLALVRRKGAIDAPRGASVGVGAEYQW
jgi:hypothetical protein